MDDVHGITSGSQFLSPTSRIWTVRAISPNGRVELTSTERDGEHGAVMDVDAVLGMVRLDIAGPVAAVEYIETSQRAEPEPAPR